jgi:hypothetical protein
LPTPPFWLHSATTSIAIFAFQTLAGVQPYGIASIAGFTRNTGNPTNGSIYVFLA